MDTLFVTSFVGLVGASVGSVTSFSSTWFAQRAQLRDAHREAAKAQRQALFGDFISEASRLYGDALGHEKDDVAELVQLYALVARMRLLASAAVVSAAERAMDRIIEAYLAPNRSLHELRELAKAGRVDFLIDFAEACREEIVAITSYPLQSRPALGRGMR